MTAAAAIAREGDPGDDAPVCLNCGAGLIGPHCHVCGQTGHPHRTLGSIGHEIAHGVFHFDGKIWRTLPLLAVRPGELTRRYVDGQRARFVSPLAMFLFSVFLMFAVVANLPGWKLGDGNFLDPGVNGRAAQVHERLVEERAKATRRIVETQGEIVAERGDKAPDAARIARLEERLSETRRVRDALGRAASAMPTGAVENLQVATGEGWLDARFRHAIDNPKLLLYKIKTSAYKFSWLLIPLSLPFLWLMFPFSRRYGPYDHAVFTTYSLTFMSLLVIALGLLLSIGVPAAIVITLATVVPPFHIYRQMKGTYRLTRTGALVRTVILLVLIMSVIVPAATAMLVYVGVAD